MALPIAIVSIPLIPGSSEFHAHHRSTARQQLKPDLDTTTTAKTVDGLKKLKQLDLVGVAALTIALILLVYGLVQGSSTKWGSAGVIAPLIISVCLIVGFLYYETLLPEDLASV